jgi:CheY-like chemotaxis protein
VEIAARVLVVDDNRDAAELAGTVLATAGHAVEVAHTGLDALHRAELASFDVIVLDIGLPDLDGYAVADELRSARFPGAAHTRIVALTGYGQATDRARSVEAGFAAHLVKPIDPARLLETVNKLLPVALVERHPPIVPRAGPHARLDEA